MIAVITVNVSLPKQFFVDGLIAAGQRLAGSISVFGGGGCGYRRRHAASPDFNRLRCLAENQAQTVASKTNGKSHHLIPFAKT